MKKILLYIGIAIAAIGCTKNDEVTLSSGDMLTISSNIATRAEMSSWTGTETIGVYMTAETIGDVGSNVAYTTSTDNKGIFTSDTPIYYPYDTQVDLLAYYPYKNVDAKKYPIISSEQVDLLAARESGLSTSSSAVDMTFEHQLSKLSITVQAEGGITATELSGVTVTISGLIYESTFDLTSNQANTNTDTENTKSNGSLTLTTTESNNTIVSSGIVIPQELSNCTLTFTTSDNRVFKGDFPTVTFDVGTEYSYTATVGYDKVAITESSISPWVATSQSGTANIVDIELKGDTYYINSAKGLAAFRDLVNGAGSNTEGAVIAGFESSAFNSENLSINGKLTRDIDLSTICYAGKNWSTIGYYGTSENLYAGTFDGGGYQISSLYIDASGNRQSLFRTINTGGVVCNLGVAGNVKNSATTHPTTNAEISYEIGGIVAYNNGLIINCYSLIEVEVTYGVTKVGGIAGHNSSSGNIVNCYNHGKVKGTTNVGGIVGNNDKGYVGYCYNTGTLIGTSRVGGVVGWNTLVNESDDPNVKGSFCLNTTSLSIGQVGSTDSSGGLNTNVCTEEYLKSESFVTTINNSCATTYNGSTPAPTIKACGFVAVSGDYPAINFGNVATNTPVDISYNSLSYNINTAKGLEAFAALVNGTAMPTGAITSGDDIYFQFANSEYSYSSIGGNLKASVSLKDICNSDSSGTNWTPIGSSSAPYKGIFNGGGFEVSYLYISESTNHQGLFGYVSGATIYNLGVGGEVTGGSGVAGVVGYNYGGTIINCYNTCTVKGVDNTGGVVGANISSGNVINIYNRGIVSGTTSSSGSIGGMVGCNSSNSSIKVGYNTGSVSTGSSVGGVVGLNEANGTVNDCHYQTGSASLCIGSDASSETTNRYSDMTVTAFLDILNDKAGDYNSGVTYKACAWVAVTSSYPIHDFTKDAE